MGEKVRNYENIKDRAQGSHFHVHPAIRAPAQDQEEE